MIDLKLAFRMLMKYPGLTLVGVLGMSVAIAIGAVSFTFLYSYMTPALPLAEGDRIVAIENWDAAASRREDRTVHDFAVWREELRSIEDVGAYREIARNLRTEDGGSERVQIAEMTASGFRLTRVAPLIGRTFVDGDERKDAPRVVVIGADAWRSRFASDPSVLGRTVRIGDDVHTIVGVMPEGFAFPVLHKYWVPLQVDAADYERRQGPAINVFGRLAPAVTRDAAQAELTTIGMRMAAAHPDSNEHLRPRLAPYTSLWFGDDLVEWHMHLAQFLVTMLLVVVCVNVASLVYARTATRFGEIAVRTALGGSRQRIVMQLFLEALVLSSIASVIGVALADGALTFVNGLMEQFGGAPFWIGHGVSLGSVFYTIVLAMLGAAIVGAVPALKATGRRIEPGLRRLRGATGLQLGTTWTTLIVAQVAMVVAVMPAALSMGWQAIGYRAFDPDLTAERYLTARLSMDVDTVPSAQVETHRRELAHRFRDRTADIVSQLEAEASVADVTFASRLPGDEPTARIEIEAETAPPVAIRFGVVSVDFFDVFRIPVLAGRKFGPADLNTASLRSIGSRRVRTVSGRIQQAAVQTIAEEPSVRSTAVIVNRSFAQRFLAGGGVLGRRVRYMQEPAAPEWYDIVGVVADFPASGTELSSADARMYHPASLEDVYPVSLVARVRESDTAKTAARMREITIAADPLLQLADVASLDQVYRDAQQVIRLAALSFGIVTLSVLLLSAAGIYALMSFTIAQRRREIGIRVALGADPRRLLAGIFSRAATQLGTGVGTGLVLAALLFQEITDANVTSAHGVVVMPAVALLMIAVGLGAAFGPARRGLRIDPTETLKAEN